MSEIHFRSVGPIGSGILTPEMVAEHEGNHQCLDDEDGSVCSEVGQDGSTARGFKWNLYGGWDDE